MEVTEKVTLRSRSVFVSISVCVSILAIYSPIFQKKPLAERAFGDFEFYSIFTMLPVCIIAFSAFCIMLKFGAIRWWTTLISGSFIGAIMSLLMGTGRLHMDLLLEYSFIGAISALSFWAVWRLSR
jgi:hypothetical protein